MKIPPAPHSWSLSPKEAMATQRALAARVRMRAPRRRLRRLAGIDCAFSGDECLAVAVLWDLDSGETLEESRARRPLRFPYVPGLLSFREAPSILAALAGLRGKPDALICDGHGFAHPRRFGIACHVGVICDLPSVGAAKSRLVGEHREPGARRGSRAPLTHHGDRIGTVLRTRDGVKPIYVSVGHRIDLDTAEQLTLAAATRYRLPHPTHLADRAVAKFKASAPPSG